MDHIPHPSSRRPFIVPCLAKQDFDGGSIDQYPERVGWGPRPRKDWAAIFEKPSDDFRAFLQTWRFFGLIAHVFTLGINDLTRPGNSPANRIIDTSNLIKSAEALLGFTKNPIPGRALDSVLGDRFSTPLGIMTIMLEQLERHRFQNSEQFQKMLRPLIFCWKVESCFRRRRIGCSCEINPARVESIDTYISNAVFTDPLSSEIRDSIDLILELAATALVPTFSERFLFEHNTESLFSYPDSLNQALRHMTVHMEENSSILLQMVSSGWCVNHVQQLRQRFGISAMIFLSNLKAPDKLDHGSCSESSCIFGIVNQQSYQRAHAHNCGRCFDVFADDDEMHEIFKRNTFPLIIPAIGKNSSKRIQVTDFKDAQKYVAISHVWSHGLGNPSHNAIPNCQFQRLSAMVASLPIVEKAETIPFWLDTICCPVKGNDDNDDQEKAIGLMRDTYEKACAVLVLDASLLLLSYKQLSDVEILLRISSSRWTSRLWTLQEGALAQRLFCQFADGAYDVQAGLDRLNTDANMTIRLTVKASIVQSFIELRIFRHEKLSNTQKLTALTRALRFRSTSQSTDEPICLFTLFGCDTQKMMAIEKGERMKQFWNAMSDIPIDVLFQQGNRFTFSPYRWAPQSLLGRKHVPLQYSDAMESHTTDAKFHSEGLICNAPVLSMAPLWKLPISDSFYICDHNTSWYWVTTNLSYCESAVRYNQGKEKCNHFEERYKVNPPPFRGQSPQLYVMLRSLASLDGAGFTEGLLLSGESTHEQIFATPICSVFVERMSMAIHPENLLKLEQLREGRNPRKAFYSVDKLSGNLCITSAALVRDRKWCID